TADSGAADSGAALAAQETILALEMRLVDEQAVNAQLEERVRALKDRQDTRMAALDAQIAGQRQAIAALDQELQALRQSNADLRDLNAQLRAAAEDGVAEPELINRAVMAELDALRATRAADVAELDAVITALKPLITEGQ
ncbi:MAG: hypothetical protein GW886_12240, partial [Rhodobacterales bacterium]|nr:hypothetical protein [Rhodobacterales bacterium]